MPNSPKTASSGPTEAPPDPKELIASTGFLLARLGSESRRRWSRMLAGQGLAPHDFGVLLMLERERPSQQELSRLVGVDPRNLVGVIDRLAARGLVSRSADELDRRRRVLALSPAGRRLLEDVRRAGEGAEQALLAALEPGERAHLHALLLKVYGAVTEGGRTAQR